MTKKGKFFRFLFLVSMLAFFFQISCNKGEDPNSDIPFAHINVVINPNSTMYQELNTISGWMYYQWVDPPSRGLIIYRLSQDEFLAYERTPPENSNACCDDGFCSALLVDDYYPFVQDTCSDKSYLIIDGSPQTNANIPLKQYNTAYDGLNLYITN